jgi:uncharacterized protein YkwD
MLSLNWVDCLILAILVLYAYKGYSSGFINAIIDLLSFIISFLIGLRFYGFIAGILFKKASLPQGFSNALGFLGVAIFVQVILAALIRNFLYFNPSFLRRLNKLFGILPGILSGAIFISFILILIVSFPIATSFKRTVSSSRVGNFLLYNAQGLEKELKNIFGGAINETINFLTVEPKSNEIISLNFKAKYVLSDPQSEKYMFALVNKERTSRGLKGLIFDDSLRDVGRSHCEDMFKRGYFSHYTPEGLSPFDRMDQAGIVYIAAGENIALAPNTDISMQGLMNSPGHKANILSISFGKVGIGVIDGGIYGEMFCQEFTN